jgi:GH24 family phage-related lysozyme (muramidase)
MNQTVVSIVSARLKREEGRRPRAYNDATGVTVTCKPGGNLSIGYGINLENGLDESEMQFLLRRRIELADAALIMEAPWYEALSVADPLKASVYLDVAYNAGVAGLLHGFPKCVKYASLKDWTNSAAELRVADASLDHSRYEPLRKILLLGTPAL